jgi:hypothetical protein
LTSRATSSSYARSASTAYSCERPNGLYEKRCRQGERDKFQPAIAVAGDHVRALHVVWANMGNRIDDVEDQQPSIYD